MSPSGAYETCQRRRSPRYPLAPLAEVGAGSGQCLTLRTVRGHSIAVGRDLLEASPHLHRHSSDRLVGEVGSRSVVLACRRSKVFTYEMFGVAAPAVRPLFGPDHGFPLECILRGPAGWIYPGAI